jgi:hypothetical protein
MQPEELYIRRAQEYAERVEQAQDIHDREVLRGIAACWLRLADYARAQRAGPPTRGSAVHPYFRQWQGAKASGSRNRLSWSSQ